MAFGGLAGVNVVNAYGCACVGRLSIVSVYVWTSFYMSLLITLAAQQLKIKVQKKQTRITICFSDSSSNSSGNDRIMRRLCAYDNNARTYNVHSFLCVLLKPQPQITKIEHLLSSLDHFVGSDYYLTY